MDVDTEFVIVVYDVNLVGNIIDSSVDIGVTSHICADRSLFTTYQAIDGKNLYMKSRSTAIVKGKG